MNYTIAHLESFGGSFKMSLNNMRHLSIREYAEDDQGEMTILKGAASETYATHEEAKEAFGKLTICVIDGTYNFADRARIAGMTKVWTA